MKSLLFTTTLALVSMNALALEGQVINDQGAPVANALVKVEGTQKTTVTDTQGHFNLTVDKAEEIHVTADGYSHRMVHLHDQKNLPLIIRLADSVIEQVDVIGLPIHASVMESALPVSVLSGEALRDSQAATLGDSLDSLPGVNTNFHGNVASTPVIRGLSGPRVLITQNSLDVSDVSRVGPDHSVASEVSTAEQVEVLRGPATLFYGSGAIGGVVNVVDKRVPTDSATQGEFLLSHETVNRQNLASFNATSGTDALAFYADGFTRQADDYEVPVTPATVANTAEESSGYTLGTSRLLGKGYAGISVGRLDREYGIPGEEGDVYAKLKQDRYQFLSELNVDLPWLHAIHTRAAYTDYAHAEIEEGIEGTVFSNQTSEARVDLFHPEWVHWKGGLNLHTKNSKVEAKGEEAFTPPSNTDTLALGVMEERHFGDVLVQAGARVERVTLNADNALLPALEGHEQGTSEDTHAEETHTEAATRVFAVEHDFTPVSVSLGAVWDFTPDYNLGVSLSHSQRAPSASELLSFGPHIGTRSYEIGALFALHEDNGEAHFELSEADFDLETANNIDLTFRKHQGDLGLIFNAFFNKIDDYYYQQDTGLLAESGHSHEEEALPLAHPAEAHADELPIYLFTHDAAEFYGFEAQTIWQLNERWTTTLFTDYVHAELADGRYLPRTPPLRLGANVDFNWNAVTTHLAWTHYAKQTKLAALETPTDGYNMLDATLTYHLPVAFLDMALFLKAENLTDTEARVHTSFIKDIAPRPGRNLSLGFRGLF